jgi:hypothetical protein
VAANLRHNRAIGRQPTWLSTTFRRHSHGSLSGWNHPTRADDLVISTQVFTNTSTINRRTATGTEWHLTLRLY